MKVEVFRKISQNDFDESDQEVRGFLIESAQRGLTDEQIIELTKAIAASGQIRDFLEPNVTDIPSTGGPSGLSTLVAPLLVSLTGDKILKVSATGRPAGAIDVLQTLPGYRYELTAKEIDNLLTRTCYVHVLQTSDFAPADMKLIKMRRLSQTMSSPDLAIASLLSKKLCVGVTKFVIDIRVGPSGNIAPNLEGAVAFSRRFVAIARTLGLSTRCVLTDMRTWPQTPYLGRGESLLGLGHVLQGTANVRTTWPLKVLAMEAVGILHESQAPQQIEERLNRAISSDSVKRVGDILEEHGVSKGAFERRLDELSHFSEFPITSAARGWIQSVDLKILKDIVTELYAALPTRSPDEPPWEVGIRWNLWSRFVDLGVEICRVRVKKEFASLIEPRLPYIADKLQKSLALQSDSLEPRDKNVVLAVIDENSKDRDEWKLRPHPN